MPVGQWAEARCSMEDYCFTPEPYSGVCIEQGVSTPCAVAFTEEHVVKFMEVVWDGTCL